MNIKYLGVFVVLLAFSATGFSVSLAQDGAQPSAGALPPIGADGHLNLPQGIPAGSFNLPQPTQAPNPNPFSQSFSRPYPAAQPLGFGTQALPVSPQQQQTPRGASIFPFTSTQPSAPTPEPPSALEVSFQTVAGGPQQPCEVQDTTSARLPTGVQNIAAGRPQPCAVQASMNPRPPADASGSQGLLRQFGYSLFSTSVSTFAPIEDVPVGPDYILGPGDNLRINIWGAMDNALVQTVDRNGQIFLPTVGPVRLWGLSFSQADQLIRQNLSRYYRGFQTSVSMGGLRSIRIYVVGEVRQPGSYTISSLSTAINALFAAGGPIKVGSLRNIELKRNHHTVGSFDLYDFLLRGDKTRDFRLESGDTIFVPPIGSVVAITGEVKRPAIYELNGTTRVEDLIQMAGGVTPQSYLKRVQILRAKPNAEREVIDLDLTSIEGDGASPVNIEIRNGDLVKIYPTDPRVYNTVNLTGEVKQPGEYEFKPDMRLSQLLPPGSLLPEAYPNRVEIVRFNQKDLTTQVKEVNLRDIWTGHADQDFSLQPGDQVTVRSDFKGHRMVTLSGEVKLPGAYAIMPGERLSSVIKRAGGFTDRAYPKGAIFTRPTVEQVEQAKLDEFLRRQQETILSQAGSTLTPVSLEQQQAREQRQKEQIEQIKAMGQRVTLGRVVVHLDEAEKFQGTESDLLLEDGDRLVVPQTPSTVLIMGSVRNPTALIYHGGEDVEYYVNHAGGLSQNADEKQMYLLKADGSALTGFLRLKDVEPGDAVIVPPRDKEKDWSWLKDLATIAGQGALGLAAAKTIIGF